jgi:hypothetical protein
VTAESLLLVSQFPDTVSVGDVVPIRLLVTNRGGDSARLLLETDTKRRGAVVFDVRVLDEAGRSVWQRIRLPQKTDPRFEIAIAGGGTEHALPPSGEYVLWGTRDLRDGKGAPVPPGRYRIISALSVGPRDSLTAPERSLHVLP